MSFKRVEYSIWLQEAGEEGTSSRAIHPQSVAVTYQVQSTPSARVDLAFGEGFSEDATSNLKDDLEQLQEWVENFQLLQIRVLEKITDTQTTKEVESDQIIFEGYLHAPSIQLVRRGASFSFILQHWTRDLAIGSLMLSYALPGHPEQRNIAAMYQESGIGGASGLAAQAAMEGISYRRGLPKNWETIAVDDIWGNVQKPLLASLLDKERDKDFPAPLLKLLVDCKDALNRPSEVAAAALARVQGPSITRGLAYSDGVAPLKISESLNESTRRILSLAIAKAIAQWPISRYPNMSVWDQMIAFCNEFGLLFIPRSQDAAIIPVNFASKALYSVEVEESAIQEVAWNSFQQMNIRGLGIISGKPSGIGGAGVRIQGPQQLPVGCFIASEDPNRGLVHFIAPPRWLADLPPDSNTAAAAKAAFVPRGVNTFMTLEESQRTVKAVEAEQERTILNNELYDAYAKMRYLESELKGRTVRFGSVYRTDIGLGSMLRVNIRPSQLVSRLNLDTSSLAGLVTALTLSVSRPRRQAAAVYRLDYARTESQLEDETYTLEKHPIFETTVLGLPLVTNE